MRRMLLAGTFVLALGAGTPSFASDPVDTPPTPSLSADEARRLVADHEDDWLALDGMTSLSADAAAALAAYEGDCLSLDGLESLDADTALALAGFKGCLSLSGLDRLDLATATALASSTGSLTLDGLATIDAPTARTLAAFRGEHLSLGGLQALPADVARIFKAFRGGGLSLQGLKHLDPVTVELLAESPAWTGWLPAVTVLTAETARTLAAVKRTSLDLYGLTSLSADAATGLAEFSGGLRLDGLRTLDGDTARRLAGFAAESLSLVD